MTDAADPQPWIDAVRASHQNLVSITERLDPAGLRSRSYATEWSIAQVLSHLGSQAEIFQLQLDSALAGTDAPGSDQFGAIWQVWDAKSPDDQARDGLAANAAVVERIEGLDEQQRGSARLNFFGMDLDLAGLLGLRLSEHAVHTWDVAVTLDDTARLLPDAVALLVDNLGMIIGWTGRTPLGPVSVRTTEPQRAFVLQGDERLALSPAGDADAAAETSTVELPAEAFIRLVYGRLDPAHTPEIQIKGIDLDDLRGAFPGP